MDVDFNWYEDDDITIDRDGYRRPINLDWSKKLNTTSSSEMNHVWNLVRDQIIKFKKNK